MAPDGRRRSVLVVDDDASYCEALASGLSGEGYTVYLAPDGRSALRLCATRTPDVVLLDLRLPDLSGTEVQPSPPGRPQPQTLDGQTGGSLRAVGGSGERAVAPEGPCSMR